MVGQERLLKMLVSLGLAKTEAEIYLFLNKEGSQRGGDIAKTLGLHKQQLYRNLKSLKCKGCVKATLEHPSRFSAMSIKSLIDLHMRANLDEAQDMEENRQRILSNWQAMMKKDSKNSV